MISKISISDITDYQMTFKNVKLRYYTWTSNFLCYSLNCTYPICLVTYIVKNNIEKTYILREKFRGIPREL